MKNKAIIVAIVTFLAIVLVTNFTPLSYILHENYTYRNYDNSFNDGEEAKGTGAFRSITFKYKDFLKAHPQQAKTDSNLYRSFTVKPWRFWQWMDFVYCPERFKLPYRAE